MNVQEVINELRGMPLDAEVLVGPRGNDSTWWKISFIMMPTNRWDPEASKIMRSVTMVTGDVQEHRDAPTKKGRK